MKRLLALRSIADMNGGIRLGFHSGGGASPGPGSAGIGISGVVGSGSLAGSSPNKSASVGDGAGATTPARIQGNQLTPGTPSLRRRSPRYR